MGPEERQIGGAVPKQVLIFGPRERPQLEFIAKKPRKWAREGVTEAMLSTIGKTLPLSMANFRLVRLPTAQSEPDIRFMSEVFLKTGESLIHGVEIAGRFFEARPDEINRVFHLEDNRREREFYTVDLVLEMLKALGRDDAERKSLISGFGRMVAFDAFVGVQDRHAENWGVVECSLNPSQPMKLSPIYDTARGLFVSHGEDKLEEIDQSGDRQEQIQRYAEKSKPIFGCKCDGDVRTINHFRLIEHMVTELGPYFGRPVRQLVGAIDLRRIEKQLQIKYARIVTRRRMEFIALLLRYRHHRLRETVFHRSIS